VLGCSKKLKITFKMFSNKNKPITPKIVALAAVVQEKIEKM
jgi:hypothetical protein